MRDLLNSSLEALIWVATGFLIVMNCYIGVQFIRFSVDMNADLSFVFGGMLYIVFGVTMSFVFAGICFQIMDIRNFSKHMAIGLKKLSQR